MRVLAIQNDEIGPAGVVGEVIIARGGMVVPVMAVAGEAIPDRHHEFDGLLVLGGLMGANDDDQYPYITAALELIRDFGGAGKPVMGICLGAQMVARANGARVRVMDRREMGFAALHLTDHAAADPLLAGLAREHRILESHGDTFDLPDGSVLLMTGSQCPNQAFRLGVAVYGFQCHLEVRPEIVMGWANAASEELRRDYPEYFTTIEDQVAVHIDRAVAFAEHVSHRWCDLVETRRGGCGMNAR